MRARVVLILLLILVASAPPFLGGDDGSAYVDSALVESGSGEVRAIVLALDGLRVPPGVSVLKKFKIIPGYLVEGPKAAVLKLAREEGIIGLWNDSRVHALSIPAEKVWRIPEALDSENLEEISVPKLWELGYNGSGVKIAILDTGIDWTHPDLDDLDDNPNTTDPKVIANVSFVDYDFDGEPDEDAMDYHGHGTLIAGIAAGTGAASNGTHRGVAPGAYLMDVKVLDKTGSGYWSWVISGIEYAAYGPDGIPNTGDEADIISMSLGGLGTLNDPVVQAVREAWSLGVTVVVAAGNDYLNYQINVPGVAGEAITVGAVASGGLIAYFSSRGPTQDFRAKPDVVAPGVGIVGPRASQASSFFPTIDNYYTSASGTSVATPHVSGIVALLKQAFPATSNNEIKLALMASARDLGFSEHEQGAGMVDAYAAYLFLSQSPVKLRGSFCREHISSGKLENGWVEASFVYQMLSTYFYYKPKAATAIFIERMDLRVRRGNTTSFVRFTSLDIKVPLGPVRVNGVSALYTLLQSYNVTIRAYALVADDKWLAIALDINASEADWVSLYMVVDPDIYGRMEDNNATYLEDSDTVYAYYKGKPDFFFAVSSVNKTSEHHIGQWWTTWQAVFDDDFNGEKTAEGDISVGLKWNVTSPAFRIAITFSFGDNLSDALSAMQRAKEFSVWDVMGAENFSKPFIAGVEYEYPLTMGNTTVNVTVSNLGVAPMYANLTAYLDGQLIVFRQLYLPAGAQENVTMLVNISSYGSHLMLIEVSSSDGRDALIKPLVVVPPDGILAFPYNIFSYPLQAAVVGQRFLVNVTVVSTRNDTASFSLTQSGGCDIAVEGFPSAISGHGYFSLNVTTRLPGTWWGLVNITVGNSSFELHYVAIIGQENLTAELSAISVREDEYYRTPNWNGVVESDEDALLSANVTNMGNRPAVFYFIATGVNWSNTLTFTWPSYYDTALLPPGGAREVRAHVYAYPSADNITVSATLVLYAELPGELVNHMGFPIVVVKTSYRIVGRTPGTPVLNVTGISVRERGDGDGFIEVGEVAEVTLNVTNVGNGTAVYVQVYGRSQNVTGMIATVHMRTLPAMEPNQTFETRYPISHYIFSSQEPKQGLVNASSEIVYYDVDGNEYRLLVTYSFRFGRQFDIRVSAEASPQYVKPGGEVTVRVNVTNAWGANLSAIRVELEAPDGVTAEEVALDVGESAELEFRAVIPAEGTYILTVRADSDEGEDVRPEDNEASVLVFGDGSPPRVVITTPENGSYTASTSTFLSWWASDDSGISNYTLLLDGATLCTTVEETFFVSGLGEGVHELTVIATDLAGNAGSASTTFFVDLTPPEIEVLEPGNGSLESPFTLRWRASDNMKLESVTVRIIGSRGTSEYELPPNQTSLQISLRPGYYGIEVTARDAAGNEATVRLEVEVVESQQTPVPPPPLEGCSYQLAFVLILVAYILTATFILNYWRKVEVGASKLKEHIALIWSRLKGSIRRWLGRAD